jgi:cyclase
MSLTKRIIPCLDIKDGQTVKGINFVDLRFAGDPVELATAYVAQGADELVFLDITATVEKRKTLAELVRRIAKAVNIPFTVGGGISSVADAGLLLEAGADKISVNSSAVKRPQLVDELAAEFGNQFVVVAIDTKKNDDWKVYVKGGREETPIYTRPWARELQERGAGEILLTSMDHDGTKAGFALDITGDLSQGLSIPVIASGGAGAIEHFTDVFKIAKADAALAASIFHFGEIPIPQLKNALNKAGITVRM